jgi:hypothetical protein
MDILSGDISGLIFKYITRDSLGKFSLDGQLLSVLAELDGRKSLAMIANTKGLSMEKIRNIIYEMLQLNLIEPVEDAGLMVDKNFFDYLNEQLSLAVGPIAGILIKDTVSSIGCNLTQFPKDMAAKLISNLASQIDDKEKLSEFQKSVFNKIDQKGG